MSSGDNLPPSFSDCKVKPEARAEIESLANCFYHEARTRLQQSGKNRYDSRIGQTFDDVEEECVEQARAMGMELLDSGVSRISFASEPDPDVGARNPDGPTAFESCVFKFARHASGGNRDGKVQQEKEIQNYERLPAELTEPDGNEPPVFNPIQDYANDYLWLTQPFCPPPGSQREVRDSLNTAGYKASDLHSENVGEYRSLPHSAIIDYGLAVEPMGGPDPRNVGDTFRDRIYKNGARDFTKSPDRRNGGADLRWYVDPDHPGPKLPSQESVAEFDRFGNLQLMDIFFPGFSQDTLTFDEVLERGENVANAVSAVGVITSAHVDKLGDDFIAANIMVESTGGNAPPPEVGADIYEAISDAYDEEFNDLVDGFPGVMPSRNRAQPRSTGEQRWFTGLGNIGMEHIDFPGRNEPEVFFMPPTDTPLRNTTRRSDVWWDRWDEVKVITYYPSTLYLDDTFQYHDSIASDHRAVADQVANQYSRATLDATFNYPDVGESNINPIHIGYEVRPDGRYFSRNVGLDVLQSIGFIHTNKFEGRDDLAR